MEITNKDYHYYTDAERALMLMVEEAESRFNNLLRDNDMTLAQAMECEHIVKLRDFDEILQRRGFTYTDSLEDVEKTIPYKEAYVGLYVHHMEHMEEYENVMEKIAEREKAKIHEQAGTFPDHAYSVENKKIGIEEIGFSCLLDAESFAVENIGNDDYTIMKYDRMVGNDNRDEYDWMNGYSPYPAVKVDLDAVD